MNEITNQDPSKSRLAATGSLLAALLASSCCIGPLLLVSLGVSGAWIGNLTALEPYQPAFVMVAVACLAFGFWQVYFRPKKVCDANGVCVNPVSTKLVKTVLWVSSALIVAALTIDAWAPLFY
jgi:mercuric ion transport protein